MADRDTRQRTTCTPVTDIKPIDHTDPNIIDISFSDLTDHVDSTDPLDPHIPPPDENTFPNPTDPINSTGPNNIDISSSDPTNPINPTDPTDPTNPCIPPPDENTFSDPTDPIDSVDPDAQPANDDHDTVHDIYHSPPQPTTVTRIRQLDISTFATQNTHGLRRIPRDTKGKPLPNESYNYTRYEHIVAMMKTKNLDIYFVQETWLKGDVFNEIINGYQVFRHNGGKGNHNFRGVAIIFSPRYHKGWKAAGARPPLTTDATSEFAGRFISLNILLTSHDKLGKQVRGKKGTKHLALTLISVYHPCTKRGADNIYTRFLDTLDSLLNKLPATNEIIMGADVNANIGKLDKLYPRENQSTIGPHGFSKRNTKGEGLLTVYLAHNLQVSNTFFECKANGPGYGTWTST